MKGREKAEKRGGEKEKGEGGDALILTSHFAIAVQRTVSSLRRSKTSWLMRGTSDRDGRLHAGKFSGKGDQQVRQE